MNHAVSLGELTDDHLRAIGVAEPDRARRVLLSLVGQGVTDDVLDELLPSLLDALADSPDPDRALGNFERWMNAVTSRYTHVRYLTGHPAALRIFFNVCGVSQLFSDILVRNPEYLEILANPGVRGGSKTAEAAYRELSGWVDAIIRPELKLDAMRRFRQRELLRIGTRDILGLADMPTTSREFSNLADACVQKCYEIAVAQLAQRYGVSQPMPFAVIAMGKLGGQELNYSSDIDLMFVCADPVPELAEGVGTAHIPPVEYAHKLAELMLTGLTRNLAAGHLFRVDMRLRPEGRFGALVRTISSYRAYYESWAEPWERQALLKARPVAGDARIGEAFRDMVTPFVYRRLASEDLIAAVRHNKARMERKAELEGQSRTNVKVGWGGIRDVEFSIQLLQLVLGGRRPTVRTPNTLDAIGRLVQSGALTRREASELAEDYQFLRTVEHRLQILYELQTQTLPVEPGARRLLARRLGYRDTEAFDADFAFRTARVRKNFEAIFLGDPGAAGAATEWEGLLANVETPAARETIEARLREAGFAEPERAWARLRQTLQGSDYGLARPESRASLTGLWPRLLASAARSGNPDGALDGIDLLAAAVPNRVELYRTLAESEDLLDRLCRLAAGSPSMMQALARSLQWLDMLASEEVLNPSPKRASEARRELEERRVLPATGRRTRPARPLPMPAFWDAVAAYLQRERLRTGARELWGEIGAAVASEELTSVADAVLAAVLARGIEVISERFPDAAGALGTAALIGLGKLGGHELGYGSDWDVLLVYADAAAAHHRAMEELAEWILSAGQELRTRDVPIVIDARLRPEGRFGALARTVDQYASYYAGSSETWERQALVKARPVAGDRDTSSRYMAAVTAAIYSAPLPAEGIEAVRHMKRRIESERLDVRERTSDIKLGHGGLSDIEFTAQLWQLMVGHERPDVRATGTVSALHALAGSRTIAAPDAARLADTYRDLTSLRNRLFLLTGISTDLMPSDPARLAVLAAGLGITSRNGRPVGEELRERFAARMRETRAIVERLFYGGEPPA